MRAINTPRLLLRPLKATDETAFCAIYTNSETMRYIGTPLTQERARRSFDIVLKSNVGAVKHLFWAVETQSNGEFIGICGARNFSAAARQIEVGIILCTNARGRGFSREALAAACYCLFSNQNIHEITGKIWSANLVALRIALNIGFLPSRDDDVTAKERHLSLYRGNLEKSVLNIQQGDLYA